MGFFGRPWEEGGLINYILISFALTAVAAFVALLIRDRHSKKVLPLLFLAVTPFIFFALISYFRFYAVLGSAPPGATVDSGGEALASIQYPIQFGMVISAALVLIHVSVYAFQRIRNV